MESPRITAQDPLDIVLTTAGDAPGMGDDGPGHMQRVDHQELCEITKRWNSEVYTSGGFQQPVVDE